MVSKDSERDIDVITKLVKIRFPEVQIEQLRVTHTADDSGIWYFWMPDSDRDDIQIESPSGQCPFVIETNRDNQRRISSNVEETVTVICSHLETS